jgi:hypothetical protein
VLRPDLTALSTLLVYESLKQYAASLPAAKIKLDDRARRHVREAA